MYVPAGTYRTQSLFLCSNTTLYLEKGCTLLGGTDRREYPILPGVLPCADEQHEAYLGGWEGNPLDCFAGLINVINAENVTITGEGCINANADNGDWYQYTKVKVIAWRPRLFFTSKAKNVTPARCGGVQQLLLDHPPHLLGRGEHPAAADSQPCRQPQHRRH